MKTLKELNPKVNDRVKDNGGREFRVMLVDENCSHPRACLVKGKPCLAAMSDDGRAHQEVDTSSVPQWSFIEEWTVYNNDLPFCELTDEQKGALLLATHEGGEVECYYVSFDGWQEIQDEPTWAYLTKYRIKPDPTPMSLDWSAIKPEYKWAAVDFVGNAWVFRHEPLLSFREWKTSNGRGVCISHLSSYKRGNVDWQHSLIERPDDV